MASPSLQTVCCLPIARPKHEDRYFAVIIKIEAGVPIGPIIAASAHVGNFVSDTLPQGARVTRSIEITKDTATKVW